ncbi:hypothetical protein [Sneathiella chinensis]|uniref:Uncharacterized protein n=1 Tax=Sneathiella chinensis TaxID=349750 RepID=A0ABQ5U1G1_9PROT|nr:hypothetical protein [Sneathiella chinensis]GLQ05510.1 hypothetical protein GCM10007924_07310 [Sneathiella chinensis]
MGETNSAAETDRPVIKEAVGIFDDPGAVHDCIEDLERKGFSRSDMTMLSRAEVLGNNYVLPVQNTPSTEDNPEILRGPILDPEETKDRNKVLLSAPLYLAALCAAGIGLLIGLSSLPLAGVTLLAGFAGGIIGIYLDRRYRDSRKGYYSLQLERGGIPLWVHTHDTAEERTAIESLTENRAHDVHIHAVSKISMDDTDKPGNAFRRFH